MKKLLLIILFFLVINPLLAQKGILLNHIDSIHAEYQSIFSAYADEIKNESKSIVFVQIGCNSDRKKVCLEEKMPDESWIFMRLVSEVENTDEVFEKKEFGGMKIVGYVNSGSVNFIVYSDLDLCLSLNEALAKINFDNFDLRGRPTHLSEIIKINGSFYRKTEFN